MTGRQLRLLIVEDEREIARALCRDAIRWGYDVRCAGTCSEAIERLSQRPDLILLDVHLPDGSGLDVAERSSEIHPRPAIVAMSGGASRIEVLRLGGLGVRHLLEKPFTARELKHVLEEAIRVPLPDAWRWTALLGTQPLPDLKREMTALLVAEAIARSDGNISQAARLLGVSRQAVQKLLR